MQIELRRLRKSYEPYRREAGYALGHDVCLIGVVLVILFAFLPKQEDAEGLYQAAMIAFPSMFVFLLFADTYIAALTLLEEKKVRYAARQVWIVRMKDAFSWTGRMFESVMIKLYPEDVRMEPYWLYAVTPTGEKFRLRCAAGRRKREAILKLMARLEKENVYVTAIYGRYSRVLIQLKGDGYDIVDVNRLL